MVAIWSCCGWTIVTRLAAKFRRNPRLATMTISKTATTGTRISNAGLCTDEISVAISGINSAMAR